MDSDVRSNRPGLSAAGALLALALSAAPAPAGGHKHHKMTFELVQGFMVQPAATAVQPIYVPYPVPVEGAGERPTPQTVASGQAALPSVSKAPAAASPPLFSTTAAAQMLAPQSAPLAATSFATPLVQSVPMQMVQVQTIPMQAQVQAVPMQAQIQAVPMQAVQVQAVPMQAQVQAVPVQVQAVPMQAAAVQVVQAAAVQAIPVQVQSTAPVQATSTLTPVQFLIPERKHCWFGGFRD